MGTKAPEYRRWTSKSDQRQVFTVLPDGCRDIVIHRTDNGTKVRVTDLDMRPRQIILHTGDQVTGYRLRPGLHINAGDMSDIKTDDDAVDLIHNAHSQQAEIRDAIDALAASSTPVRQIARQLGVSLRTLQRHLRKRHLPPPEFWRLLGRARRVAIALSSDVPLVDVAGMHGYSDQSHMNRACLHWFGQTPRFIRHNASMLADIDQPALGTWTGEQISTR